jgi:hypothetical protein
MRCCRLIGWLLLFFSLPVLTNPGEAQVVVDGQDPPSKPHFLVDIASVDVRRTAAGPTFVLKGTSKFPDGTQATLAITFKKEMIPDANRFVTIKDGVFHVTWDAAKLWPKRKFFPGNYDLKVKVRFSMQKRSLQKLIEKELGKGGKGIHERNMFVTLGTAKEVKREEDKLKEHYVHAIRGAEKLLDALVKKYAQANMKFRRQFQKLDKNGRPKTDPKNSHSYLVDERKFQQHLRDDPNEFYDDKGRFKKDAWRKWLDGTWRAQLKELYNRHRRMRGDYVIIAWQGEYNKMTMALRMLLRLSADYSARVYRWNNLALDPKDKAGGGSGGMRFFTGDPPNPRDIRKMLKEVWLNLRLDRYLESKKREKAEKKIGQ